MTTGQILSVSAETLPSLYTVNELAAYLKVYPGTIKALIGGGKIRARQDGLISARAIDAFIHRQQRITRRYIALLGAGLTARRAWAQASDQESKARR